MKRDGVLFHAKHAYRPNSLGFCGPDENGTILSHLQEGSGGDALVRTLQNFEAAYPFLKLIARNSARKVFDYSVPEAYWVGNDLLSRVDPADFLKFAREELKGSGMKNLQASFKPLEGGVIAHHSFYVMGTYVGSGGDGPNIVNDGRRKVAELIDSCRVSWGTVLRVEARELAVKSRPLRIGDAGLSLGEAGEKMVKYDPEVRPFGSVRAGDVVSIHWNYACEVLSPRQTRNIQKYTAADMQTLNRLLSSDGSRRK